MKCKKCGGDRFSAHQACYLDVIVDDENNFLENDAPSADAAIYESSKPYGPYTCKKCGTEVDELS